MGMEEPDRRIPRVRQYERRQHERRQHEPSTRSPRGQRKHVDTRMLALAIVFVLCIGTVWAQPQLEHLHFDRGPGPVGEAEYHIGMNAFTAAQLGYFLASVERFLVLADDLSDGDRVTLRQEGERGYIALTAYENDAAPRYVLTLAAEEPTGITSRSGLEALWVLLAEQLEPVAAGRDMSFANP